MLGINSEKGQKRLKQERYALNKFGKIYGFNYIETPKSETANIDGFIQQDNHISAAVEVKVRSLTKSTLEDQFQSFLISTDKIENGREISKRLKVPFYIIAYLYKNNLIYLWKAIDKNGTNLLEFEVEKRTTQKDVREDSGEKIDEVALLNVNDSDKYKI